MTSVAPPSESVITIVSGLPRSGTSLMMQMLHAGGLAPLTDGVRVRDEDNPRGYYEYEPVKRTKHDPSWLDAAGGKAVKMVHLLISDLPPGRTYRVVFMDRDLREVVASQRTMLDRQGRRGADLSDAALMKLYEGQLAKVKRAAAARGDLALIEVRYRDVIDDPAAQAAVVNAFLGGHLDAAAMAAAVDPALYRNRR